MKNHEQQRKSWSQAEKKDSKLFRTKLQRGSGNQDHHPTDSTSDTFAIETKFTSKESYSISKKTWNKLVEETAQLNAKDNKLRVPVLSLHIDKLHLVVLEYDEYNILAEKAWKYDELRD